LGVFGDWTIGKIEIISKWGGFFDGEVSKIGIFFKKGGLAKVFLKILPFFSLEKRSIHRYIIAQIVFHRKMEFSTWRKGNCGKKGEIVIHWDYEILFA